MPILSSADRQRMRDAVGALPEQTRTVYLAHLLDDEDYRAIGAREGLSVREVERHIAEAIVLIDRYLRRSRGDADRMREQAGRALEHPGNSPSGD